jgi:FSR family fosmidomycin resistance protein-like MFS transporter
MFAHLVIDALCVSALLKQNLDPVVISMAIILYDCLAFALQPMLGLLTDIKNIDKQLLIVGLLIASVASLINPGVMILAMMLGIGNAMVHIGGFAIVNKETKNKIAPLGLFVSTGTLGLGMGTIFPSISVYFAIVGIIMAFWMIFFFQSKPQKKVSSDALLSETADKIELLPLMLIASVVFLRGFGGSIIPKGYLTNDAGLIMIYVAIFLGKALGGWLADRFGILKTTLIGFLPSMIGLFFFNYLESVYWFSLLLFNLTMPLTLYLAIQSIKRFPSFAFGLTAAFLFIGMFIAYGLKELMDIPKWTIFLIVIATSVIIVSVDLMFRNKTRIFKQ